MIFFINYYDFQIFSRKKQKRKKTKSSSKPSITWAKEVKRTVSKVHDFEVQREKVNFCKKLKKKK
jgi:hypothetical protein